MEALDQNGQLPNGIRPEVKIACKDIHRGKLGQAREGLAAVHEALELFIARHPDHPLADRAREDIKALGK